LLKCNGRRQDLLHKQECPKHNRGKIHDVIDWLSNMPLLHMVITTYDKDAQIDLKSSTHILLAKH